MGGSPLTARGFLSVSVAGLARDVSLVALIVQPTTCSKDAGGGANGSIFTVWADEKAGGGMSSSTSAWVVTPRPPVTWSISAGLVTLAPGLRLSTMVRTWT